MLEDPTKNAWHTRMVDLDAFAGKTVSAVDPMQSSAAPAGSWDIFIGDISLVSSDGTFIPIYSRGLSALTTTVGPGVSGFSAVTQKSIEFIPPEDATFYHEDQIGSTRLLTAVTGWPVDSETYYPYGQGPQSGTNHYLFTGKERDSESGLDYFNARYYPSWMGRFMSPDPLPWLSWQNPPESASEEEKEESYKKFESFISNPQNFNMYAYVNNNPLNHTDPTGMAGCKAGNKTFSTCTITVTYDPKTSKGTLVVTGMNKGDKSPTELFKTDVVVGGDGYVTPTGTFTAKSWEKDHVSTLYGKVANTPWSKTVLGGSAFGPYQLHIKELDSRGIMIHGTMGPGWSPTTWGNSIFLSPTSHGCIRMCNSADIELHNTMPNPSGNKIIIQTNP